MEGDALVVLVGITAGGRARSHVKRYLAHHSQYDIYVPTLPFRRLDLRNCAGWLSRYLETTVVPQRYKMLHGIAYIAGGMLLRCLPAGTTPMFGRMVHFRSPIQERVADRFVRRFGRLLAFMLGGRVMLDLADGWPAALPQSRFATHEGLIIELGQSRMARLLDIRADTIPAEEWAPSRLLPAAVDVLRIPESHDDVYTTERVLVAALNFVRHGAFTDVSDTRHELWKP